MTNSPIVTSVVPTGAWLAAVPSRLRIGIALAGGRSSRSIFPNINRSAHPVVATFEESSLFLKWYRRGRGWIEPIQFMAGFVFAIGVLARLPIILGAPFFLFVGAGGTFFRRALAAGLGAAIPVGLLLLYNFASTGHIFNPAYDWIYHREYLGYMPPGLDITKQSFD